jgi:hypothetical protein
LEVFSSRWQPWLQRYVTQVPLLSITLASAQYARQVARFEVLMEVNIKTAGFWAATACSLVVPSKSRYVPPIPRHHIPEQGCVLFMNATGQRGGKMLVIRQSITLWRSAISHKNEILTINADNHDPCGIRSHDPSDLVHALDKCFPAGDPRNPVAPRAENIFGSVPQNERHFARAL